MYLSEHSEVSEWVILDHLDLRSLSERAVWCSSNIEGIKMDGKQQLIVKMLGCRYVSKEAVKKKEHKAVIKENKLERSKEFKKNAKAKKSIERAAKLKEKQKKDMFLEDRLY